ncbi:MAG: ATP-binding protein [Elusimicrobia bacterium]|nr:ATP-binding protein [Elusimicrobiota bacterium]
MKTEVTFLGFVRRVIGAKALVEVSQDVPSASPIIHGRVYRLGQVGSFVRIPLGFLNLYGVVSMVGASELTNQDDLVGPLPHGQRWIEVQLVGESYGREGFQRGVSVFPTLDDEVHIVTEDDLAIIYGTSSESMVEIGTHAASESLAATLDLDKIVTRHAAIVGSTGSGKSNTIAGFLKALTNGSFPSARVIVIDPHGEYAAALEGRARVFSIGDATYPLIVPYWALSFDELAWFLVGRKEASEDIRDLTFRDKVFEMKQANTANLKAGSISDDEITPESPIPFDIRQLWFDLDRPERVTYEDRERQTEALIEEGDAQKLKPAKFKPHSPYNQAPYKSQPPVPMLAYANKILTRLKDKRFKFLLEPELYTGKTNEKDLHDLLGAWIEHETSITVLDLGGVPFEVIDLVVGVVTRMLFEGMFWGRDLPGIGKQRPVLLVYEEAHAYLPKGGTAQFIAGYAGRAVRRVFKEGRKYGVGAIIVSQRPSELDETILSQCGTFFALRLSNSDDQSRIKSTVPDALAGLVDLLPALRTGEALVLGEAVQIPSRIRLPLIEPRPKSDDPEPAKRWKEKRTPIPPYDKAVTGWRRQRMATLTDGGNKDG